MIQVCLELLAEARRCRELPQSELNRGKQTEVVLFNLKFKSFGSTTSTRLLHELKPEIINCDYGLSIFLSIFPTKSASPVHKS
jgi:hypothetical protein